jgi:hypothetical protein
MFFYIQIIQLLIFKIQDKNYYSGYEDAKHSLKLKKEENLKGFYRAAIYAYHLTFILNLNIKLLQKET